MFGRKAVNERFLHTAGQQPPRIIVLAVEDLWAALAAVTVLVHVNGQHQISGHFLAHGNATLHILPLFRDADRRVVAKVVVLPAGKGHGGSLRGQSLFNLKGHGEVDVLFPCAAVPGACAAVVAAMAGVYQNAQTGQGKRHFHGGGFQRGDGLFRRGTKNQPQHERTAEADREQRQQAKPPSEQGMGHGSSLLSVGKHAKYCIGKSTEGRQVGA